MIEKKIWTKNFLKCLEVLDRQLLSVAILKCGSIGAEMGYARNMRLLLIANPKTFQIIHKCQDDQDFMNKAPCWHLAAGLDLIAFYHGRVLNLGKPPLGTVGAVNEYVLRAEAVQDITPAYLKSRGFQPRTGDFKLITLTQRPQIFQEPKMSPAPKKGLWSRFVEIMRNHKEPGMANRWT